jgi:DNA helicase-4
LSTTEWSGEGWQITVGDAAVTVTQISGPLAIPGTEASRLDVRRRWFSWRLLCDRRRLVRLRGIRNAEASALRRALRRLALAPAIAEAAVWRAALEQLLARARAEQRWIPIEAVNALLATRPQPGLLARARAGGLQPFLTAAELEALRSLDANMETLVAGTNKEILAAELSSRRRFFDTIETSPLTDEQVEAVVCFDNRVQVLAAAGSGKTSVMVARAAYAVHRGLVTPDRILLLAFNRVAATELQERIVARFASAGLDSTGVRASTFHAFGLDVIGRATGEKPRLARWLDQGEDVQMVLRIVSDLRTTSASFRYHWELYRTLFANAPTSLDEKEPDGYDRATGQTGYRTFAGEVVKSHGERLIANFLYLNGVNYVYERPYEVNGRRIASSARSEYRPDFYYPDVDVWHEHWALDRDGRPPAAFPGYAQDMAWKRRIHGQYGTTLVESTWAEVMFGDGLAKLRDRLTGLGLTFTWDPDRPARDRWVKPVADEDLARMVRTFMAHVKSNSWTAETLQRRLTAELAHLAGFRTRLFLDLYWQVHQEWEQQLAADRSVDFEDMVVQAATYLEAGEVSCPYDLILVDEFQDMSQARARVVRALVNRPGSFLLAVGDDWQAINRFAGSDISVMTGFETWFGQGRQLALTTTFRCTQTICDVARRFVMRNPAQFKKAMQSVHPDPGPPVTVVRTDNAAGALVGYLNDLSARVSAGTILTGPSGRVSVNVLGRYGFERDVLPSRLPSNLQVTFRTVHGSKGLEADYIVIPGLITGTYGFPSTIADDPVLDLAMPAPESFRHAEERRLLYVALTRARREVTIITSPTRMSPFVVELLRDPGVSVIGSSEEPAEVCPECGRGTLVRRKSGFGPFLACSTFPGCTYTRPLRSPEGSGSRRRRR